MAMMMAMVVAIPIAGPTGTGKTVNVVQHLQTGVSDSFVPLCLAFSAQTSANQTQVRGGLEAPERTRVTSSVNPYQFLVRL